MTVAIECTAVELVENRCVSRIGTEQRHYLLHPELDSAVGAFSSVIVVPGKTSTYVFAANEDGGIGDYQALAVVPGTVDPPTALSQLAYRIDAEREMRPCDAPEGWDWAEQSRDGSEFSEKVTVVYPVSETPVTYPDCEIDEVDNHGYLRIAAVSVDESRVGFQYMVWAPGAFSRAETLREASRDERRRP